MSEEYESFFIIMKIVSTLLQFLLVLKLSLKHNMFKLYKVVNS